MPGPRRSRVPRWLAIGLAHHRVTLVWSLLLILGLTQDLLVFLPLGSRLASLQTALMPHRAHEWLRALISTAPIWGSAVVLSAALFLRRHLGRLRPPGGGGPRGPSAWGPVVLAWVLTQGVGLSLMLALKAASMSGCGGLDAGASLGASWVR